MDVKIGKLTETELMITYAKVKRQEREIRNKLRELENEMYNRQEKIEGQTELKGDE